MKESVFKGIIINIFIFIAISLLKILNNKYFLANLDVNQFGMINLFAQFLNYLNLIELGLGTASTYALYKPLSGNNYEEVNIILSTMENIYNKIIIVVGIVSILLIPLFPYLMKGYTVTNETYICWILYVLNTLLGYITIKEFRKLI